MVFSYLMDALADSSRLLIVIIFGGIGMTAVFVITDQIVQNSGYFPLQTTYQYSSTALNAATDVKDKHDLGIAALMVIGALITAIIAIAKYL